MIAQELEVTLHMAFMDARQKRHEFISVEHLLLAMLDNPSAVEVLRACGANIEAMREQLGNFIEEHTPKVEGEQEVDTQPTLGFQRVIQRAILHVQSSGKKEVTGANVLVAVFGEKDSHAVYFLSQQGVTRLDIVNFISHGITKTPQGEPLPRSDESTETNAEAPSASQEKLPRGRGFIPGSRDGRAPGRCGCGNTRSPAGVPCPPRSSSRSRAPTMPDAVATAHAHVSAPRHRRAYSGALRIGRERSRSPIFRS